ncbi:17298_t:CDS:1, partial [Acaulospora colombiana]
DSKNTDFPNSPPRVSDLKTYGDGTILIRIVRLNPDIDCAKQPNYLNESCTCLEKLLSFRIINLDGAVKEININNTNLGLDP